MTAVTERSFEADAAIHATPAGQGKLFVALSAVFFIIFLITGEYQQPYGVDAFTNAVQARAFAEDQSPILEELDNVALPQYQGTLHWLVSSPNGTTSQYPPGAALWGTPFYLFDSSLSSLTLGPSEGATSDFEPLTIATPSTLAPATVAAALSVAIAMGVFGVTITKLLPRNAAIAAMTTAALGTGAWSVASDKLWQHGPAMMWISIGTYCASRDRFALSGLAFAAGVLTRPHVAIIAASIGVAIAVNRRSLREIATLGTVSLLGVIGLAAYNAAVFDSASLAGGYRLTGFNGETTDSPLVVLSRLGASLVDGRVGVLWTSPFIGLALIAVLSKSRRGAPPWAIGAAIGGLLYLVIQYRTNRVTGGGGFFSYRYPLEALVAAGPLFAYATWRWIQDSKPRAVALLLAVTFSVLTHGAGSLVRLF